MAAFREWTFWVSILKLPEDLYWDSTPREIHGCIVEFWRMQDIENQRAGTVCAAIRNAQRTKDSDPIAEWSDFFPPITEQPKKRTSLDRLRADWAKSHEALNDGALRR